MFKLKSVKKVSIVLSLCLMMTLMISGMANAAAGTRTAKNSFSQYSWVGLHCYTMGVEGNYHSNGTKIDTYSTTKAVTDTSGTWSAHDKSSSWTYKGKTTGTVKAYATFKNGAVTTWFELAWQTFDESCSATARK